VNGGSLPQPADKMSEEQLLEWVPIEPGWAGALSILRLRCLLLQRELISPCFTCCNLEPPPTQVATPQSSPS
jgi:hypothetical protein